MSASGSSAPDLGRRRREPAQECSALIFRHAEDTFRLLNELGGDFPRGMLMSKHTEPLQRSLRGC